MRSTTEEETDWRATTGSKKVFCILKYATALACIITTAYFAAYTKQTFEPYFAAARDAGNVVLAQLVFVTLVLAVLYLCAQLALLLRRSCLRCLDRKHDEGEPAADAAAAARCGRGRLLLGALVGLGALALGTVPAIVAGVRWRAAFAGDEYGRPDLAARANGLVVAVGMSLGWGVLALLLTMAPYVESAYRHAKREREKRAEMEREAVRKRRVARREFVEWCEVRERWIMKREGQVPV